VVAAQLSGSQATTSTDGIAGVTSWTLGSALGHHTVTASASSVPSVTFDADAPAVVEAIAGLNQVAVNGSPVR
jgi:hypothetical protein